MAKDAAYQEAERKIEEACRLGATELGRSAEKLTESPESLNQLAQLEST